MKKHCTLFLLTTIFLCNLTMAQSFHNLETGSGKNLFSDGRYKIFFRHTNMSGKYTEPLSMPTVNFSLKVDEYEKKELRYSFENALIGDGLFTLVRGFKRMNNNEKGNAGVTTDRTEKTLTSGLVGWHKVAINVIEKEKFLISPGISIGDHMISTTLRSS